MRISKKKLRQVQGAIGEAMHEILNSGDFFDQGSQRWPAELDGGPEQWRDDTKLKFDLLSEMENKATEKVIKVLCD